MLTLDLPTEPYWLDLPRGVRVEIRPVTTAVMAAAQAGSARRLGAIRASETDLDPDMARGLAFAFLVKALVRDNADVAATTGRFGQAAVEIVHDALPASSGGARFGQVAVEVIRSVAEVAVSGVGGGQVMVIWT